jgi:hypothetical protein
MLKLSYDRPLLPMKILLFGNGCQPSRPGMVDAPSMTVKRRFLESGTRLARYTQQDYFHSRSAAVLLRAHSRVNNKQQLQSTTQPPPTEHFQRSVLGVRIRSAT